MTEERESLRKSIVEARDLSEAWFLCLKEALEHGYKYKIDTGSFESQRRKEIDFLLLDIKNPGIRPLVPDVPQGVPAPTTMEYIEGYLPYLMTSYKAEREQYTYGQDLEPQIAKVIEMYKRGFGTNQACMAVGSKDSIDLSDPPCLRMIDTRIRYGKLCFVVYFRSWDLWGGFPSNLAAIQLLKEHMASEVGVGDGQIIVSSKGLHLYEHSWELAKAVLRMKD